MRVCTVGAGYVGLVTGACLAHVGHDVICVDNDFAKVKLLQSGQSPIYEPGLSEIIRSARLTDRLKFTTDLALGVEHGEITFIAVGTPSLPNGATNTQYVEAVAKGIGQHLNGSYTPVCGLMGYSYLHKPHSERGREFKVSSICLRTAVR